MRIGIRPFYLALAAIICLVAVSAAAPPASEKKLAVAPDFNRDVRPILSNHCFKCHGPDDKQRAAGLRLDIASVAYAKLSSGRRAIDVAHPSQSEILNRIAPHAGALQMPPASANKPLTDAEKLILSDWVKAGGKYEPHWAFVAPKRSVVPKVRNTKWVRNPIDAFILSRLEKANLTPEPEADRYTLIRRVSLDLTGIPPTPEEADAFVRDTRTDAYERLVDRLLASPHYGERWARLWLDLARYADTNGYEKDRPRSIWPYRDWVIRSLNADMPFDQFTIAQIAGDMLPGATQDNLIATGFHRNTMLNEEGGADPLEYRFHAMTDRIATTGGTWLGLTVGCAQCHTHKYDPIPHQDYYRLMAFLDNADEIPLPVKKPDIAQKRASTLREADRREEELALRYPLPGVLTWASPTIPDRPMQITTSNGGIIETLPDGSARLSGANPESNVYTVTLEAEPGEVTAIRLEALTDPTLGHNGPGRTEHGNFVLTEVSATIASVDAPAKPQSVRFRRAEADAQQNGFPASAVLDGKDNTGWAISGDGNWNVNHTLILTLDKPLSLPKGGKFSVRLAQNYGSQHTIGRFRMSVGRSITENNPRPEAERRRERFDAAFAAWKRENEAKAVRWTALKPLRAHADVPVLRILPDFSVFSTSDITKRDVYEVAYESVPAGATALRLEAIPDERLPGGGPGRVYYEGEAGDFFLNELSASIGGQAIKLTGAIASIGNPKAAVDGDALSGWSISGGQGKTQTAIFSLPKPLSVAGALSIKMVFERYYASSLGRFRIAYSLDPKAGQAALHPETEAILTTPEATRTLTQNDRLRKAFLAAAPELAGERAEIDALRRSAPAFPTTLIFQERPADNPRTTYIRHRGEFLQPEKKVTPGVLSILNPLPKNVPANRLTFARWLVSPENPLTARVTVNRQWAALFGKGIVRTVSDFGYQGESPSHPELLDYLAVDFMQQGWSLKKLHRLIVTSATYRQSSRVTPGKLTRDPENRLLARAPRIRLDAELIRDAALSESGLLSRKMYGPGVFPPQQPGVTTEGTYGPLNWEVSPGEDRYRRGLYTFAKRTAPYATFTTFDAPSGEATCPRREMSNTPLQALTLLNNAVFVEAAQSLGGKIAQRPGSTDEKAAALFRSIVTRPPDRAELAALTQFYTTQKTRLTQKELDAKSLAAPGDGDPTDRAAWTLLSRAVLNLDEAFVKR